MNRKYGHKGPVYDAARTVALAQPRVRQAATVPWLSDATPTWTGKHTFNAGITFGGGTAVNIVTVPDNVADALSIEDAGGTEYVRVVSTDANPYLLIDPGAAGINVGIGTTSPGGKLEVASGNVFFGDTANANMTVGLTINQGANDDEILALKSSDVGHPMTARAEADTFFTISKSQANSGGAAIVGYKDSADDAGYAIALTGRLGEAADTDKTTSAIGVVTIGAEVTDGGTGRQAVGADGNLVVIRNHNTARFIFDAEGSAHADVEFVAFSDHDDAALLADLEDMALAWRDPVKAEASGWLAEKREALEALNLAHFDPELPGHVMLNLTRLQMLLVGACRQQAARIKALEARCN